MTITDDNPQVIDDGFDTKPAKPKRGTKRAQPDPATDRRRGPRVKKDRGEQFRNEVSSLEVEADKLQERVDRDRSLADAATQKADTGQAQVDALRAHVELLKSSPLFTLEATQ